MNNISFYVSKAASLETRYFLVCKIAQKAAAKEQPLYIQCTDQAQAELLDDLLWTFDDTSFIPHALLETELDETPLVLLGTQAAPDTHTTVLINLANAIPKNIERYGRIIEIVCNEPDVKQLTRQHFRDYQSAGLTPEVIKV